jgi:hypothetical protein
MHHRKIDLLAIQLGGRILVVLYFDGSPHSNSDYFVK